MIYDPLSMISALPAADLVRVTGTDRDTGETFDELVPVATITAPVTMGDVPRED